VVAAAEQTEEAGGQAYHAEHMGAIFDAGFSFSGYERDYLGLNLGTGEVMDISGVSGVDSISDGRGSVFADFDNDGDLDIFLTTAQRTAHHLFRNNVGSDRGHLRVSLEGSVGGPEAYGAVVRVKTSRGIQAKLKAGGSGYLSQSDPRLLFGLGDDTRVEWVEVRWPGGAVERVEDVPSGASLRFVEGRAGAERIAERGFRLVDPLSAADAFLARLGIRRGERFPDLAFRTLAGETAHLDDFLHAGRRTLINLWATWCVPCAEEIPELERLRPSLERHGTDLLGVSLDLDTADAVPAYLVNRGVSYPVVLTDEAALDTLYPTGEATVPISILLDPSGAILEVYPGWSATTEAALERLARGEKPAIRH
jgi:thiol-disulfide isomerase/thioredoxin